MSSERTPTTDRIRDLHTYAVAWDMSDTDQFNHIRAVNRDEFDRWLEAERARVAAQALRDFADANRFPNHWLLFRRYDGSGVTVSDLLREEAARIRDRADTYTERTDR